MDRVERLISDFLDGELAEPEATRLATLLHSDPVALHQFVVNSFVHFQLLDWMDQQHMPDQTMSEAFPGHDVTVGSTGWSATAATLDTSSSSRHFLGFRPTGAAQIRQRLHSFGALAAALLVAASIAVVVYVTAARPVFVGQLTDAAGCRWAASQPDVPVGTLLQKGQSLELIQGRAVITFSSGAKVHLEGPAALRLDSAIEVHLSNGRLAAKVPRQAVGFAVTSSLANFVDLGTAFALHLDAEKSFELHVFEGLVEVRLDERFGSAARHPVRVADVQAVSFDVKSDDVGPLHFQEGKQMPF